MRKESATRGSFPCRWGPQPRGWSGTVRWVTHTRSPLLNHVLGSGVSCPASCLIWGTPHWKADLIFLFYTFWQMTGPARRLLCLQRLGPPVRSPPEQPRAVIPAQDSLRTTEVPYNQISCRSPRCCFSFCVFTPTNLLSPRLLQCCAAALNFSFYARTCLSFSEWSAMSCTLIFPPAYQSVHVPTWRS